MEFSNLFFLLEEATRNYKNKSMLQVVENGNIKTKSYYDIYENVIKNGKALIQSNITEKNVALIDDFKERWITCFFSLIYASNTVVPMDGELPIKDIIACLYNAECYTVFISKKFYEKYEEEYDKYNDIDFIVYDSHPTETWLCKSKKSQNWNKDYAMIVYTSGTSGDMKPVALTHKNIISDVEYCYDIMRATVTVGDSVLSVLPPFHMFQVTAGFLAPLKLGCNICYYDVKYMEKAMIAFSPNIIIAVPAILEGIGKKVKYLLGHNLIETPVSVFGNRLRTIICGGASLNNETLKEYKKWNIEVLVGYGMTECSPVIVCNSHGANRLGSVGCIKNIAHCNIKIIEGEIYIGGNIVFPGYYNGEKTKEFFATGDLGYIDNDDYLYITGRKKNIIVTSGGDNISPELIEKRICESRYIEDVLVELTDNRGIQILTARIIPSNILVLGKELENLIEQEVKNINREMPRHMKIDKIVIEKEFDRTSTGKKRRFNNE